jgi:hypothetical protein
LELVFEDILSEQLSINNLWKILKIIVKELKTIATAVIKSG